MACGRHQPLCMPVKCVRVTEKHIFICQSKKGLRQLTMTLPVSLLQLSCDVLQHYKPNRGRYSGFKVDFSNYKILDPSAPLPEGYQWLVEGCEVAVPVDWLQSVLGQCEGRSPSFLLTMIINGMVRPYEVLHGGTSAYTGTYLQPVINALKMYGVMKLNFTMSQATRVLNVKLCTDRRTQKRQFARAYEQT